MPEQQPFPLEQRVEEAEAFLARAVADPTWDRAAALHGKHLPEPENPARLESIAELTKHYDLRRIHKGKQGGDSQRRRLDYGSGKWGEWLNLEGIDDPNSPVSQEAIAIHDDFGLRTETRLPDDCNPAMVVALGAAGKTNLNRAEKSLGARLTHPNEDGTYPHPQGEPDTKAHRALALQATLHATVSGGRAIDEAEHREVASFAPYATTEFEVMSGANKALLRALTGEKIEEEEVLFDPGYAAKENESGLVVIQKAGKVTALSVRAPSPANREHAQTPHTLTALGRAVEKLVDLKYILPIPEGSTVALVTNAIYGRFQRTAGETFTIGSGLRSVVTTFTPEQAGDEQAALHPQLRPMSEVRAFARQLEHLNAKILSVKPQ